MSKTNPAEPEEATDQPQRRVVSGPPRFDQLQGAVGSCCRHCGQSIRQHIGGFCNPEDGAQSAAEVADSFPEQPEPTNIHWEEPPQTGVNEIPERYVDIPRNESREEFTLADTGRMGIVEQALELLQILPDCPERDFLAKQCAVAIGQKMMTVGYISSEEEQQ
jgi:hypothetical protein